MEPTSAQVFAGEFLGTAACGAFEIPAQFTNFTKEIATTVGWCGSKA